MQILKGRPGALKGDRESGNLKADREYIVICNNYILYNV